MYFSIEIHKKGRKNYVAACPELNLETPAATREKALNRMEKVLLFYLNSAKEMGIEPELLEFASRKHKKQKELLH